MHPIPPYRHRQASALEAPYTTPSINLNVEAGRSIYLRTESPTGLGSIDTFMVEEQELTALKMLEGMSSAW